MAAVAESKYESPETIISTYKMLTSECQQIATKIQEFNLEKEVIIAISNSFIH